MPPDGGKLLVKCAGGCGERVDSARASELLRARPAQSESAMPAFSSEQRMPQSGRHRAIRNQPLLSIGHRVPAQGRQQISCANTAACLRLKEPARWEMAAAVSHSERPAKIPSAQIVERPFEPGLY